MRKMKLVWLFLMFAFSINIVSVFGQESLTEQSGRNELNQAETSSYSSAQVRSILNTVREETQVPAITAAIITADSISNAAVGVRGADQTGSVRKDDKFHIGSISKSVTSTLAAKLVELGRIRWTTTVGEAFPEFASEINPAFRNVTLEQLLRHRAGLAGYDFGEELLSAGNYTGTPKQRFAFARFLLTQPPRFEVGAFNYSNAGYGIAGAMLERAARSNWESLIKYGLFASLDADAVIGWAGFNNPNQPWGHFEPGTIYNIPGQLFTPHDPNDLTNLYSKFPPALAPSGDISLNAKDLAKYVQTHLRGLMGRNTYLLKSSTIRRLHQTDGTQPNYASGWFEFTLNGVPTSFHNGSLDPFFCVVAIQPTRGKAAVSIVNAGGERGENAAYFAVERLLGIGSLRTAGQNP